MFIKSSLLLCLLFCSSLQAVTPSFNQESFCSDRQDESFLKTLIEDESSQMVLRNQGGIFNGGVCWWHSRFQRNAIYLTIFRPDQPRPTKREALEIIRKIRFAHEVIEIPGFINFREFALEYAYDIQLELEKWQKFEGFFKFAWIEGLRGKSKVKAQKLKKLMDKIYDEVENDNSIAYNKLQIPGITAHAWLVVNMEKLEDGYILKILDSNFPNEIQSYRYHIGDTQFNYHGYFRFVPYLAKQRELKKLKRIISTFCS